MNAEYFTEGKSKNRNYFIKLSFYTLMKFKVAMHLDLFVLIL